MNRVALLVVTALLAACAQIKAPTQEETDAADYGPDPVDQQSIIKRYYEYRLKDPASAQYRDWSKPVKYWFGTRGTSTFGYLVCVAVNAKNSLGGYTGFQTDGFLLRNGNVVRHFEKGSYGASGQVCGGR